MDAGKLNERIAFDSRGPVAADAPDDGNTQGDFVERFVLWTRRTYRGGSEAVIASRLEGRQPVFLMVRASSFSRQITTDWQARDTRSGKFIGGRWTGVTYEIKAINLTEDRAWYLITAETGTAS
jgi:head-tail adaptor